MEPEAEEVAQELPEEEKAADHDVVEHNLQ